MKARVGIVAAVPGEIKPLVEGWERVAVGVGKRAVFRAEADQAEVLVIAGGMGARAAALAVDTLAAVGPLSRLVSAGWAGGLSCGVYTGTAYRVDEVIEPRTGERFATEPGSGAKPRVPLKLVTADRIVMRSEKSRLAESYGASLVDMEAATVARLAAARGIPFACWKAISDRATDELPDMNRFLDSDGQLSMARLLLHVGVRPRSWSVLRTLGKNADAGARALKDALEANYLQGETAGGGDGSSQ